MSLRRNGKHKCGKSSEKVQAMPYLLHPSLIKSKNSMRQTWAQGNVVNGLADFRHSKMYVKPFAHVRHYTTSS